MPAEHIQASRWRLVRTLALIGLSVVLLRAATGCTPPTQDTLTAKVTAGIRAAHEATNKARDGFIVTQRTAEAVIVAAAPSEAAGIDALGELDIARAPVLRAFSLAYAALARAESLIALVEAGKRDPSALIQAAIEVARTAEAVYAAVRGAS